jgi:hypothetical protein
MVIDIKPAREGALGQHSRTHICSGASGLKFVGVRKADPRRDQNNVSGHLRSDRLSGVREAEGLAWMVGNVSRITTIADACMRLRMDPRGFGQLESRHKQTGRREMR